MGRLFTDESTNDDPYSTVPGNFENNDRHAINLIYFSQKHFQSLMPLKLISDETSCWICQKSSKALLSHIAKSLACKHRISPEGIDAIKKFKKKQINEKQYKSNKEQILV